MNDFMSLGIHRFWKDELISMISYPSNNITNYIPRHLDVAGGTGDIAFRSLASLFSSYSHLIDKLPEVQNELDRQIVICDINKDMLEVGRQRAVNVVGVDKSKLLGFVEGNAEILPFPDESFDIYTIAFGLRNVTNKDLALKEAFRVLRKGGRILILEFSQLDNPTLQYLYDQYSFTVIPQLGQLVANDKESYVYLVESIRKFPNQITLLNMMKESGFRVCNYKNLTFGVVAIHSGYKI
eukprot:gene19775-25713_t